MSMRLDKRPDKKLTVFKSGYATVFFEISIKGTVIGRLEFELFENTMKTSENFRALCTGEKGIGKQGKPLSYRFNVFHRVVPNFII